MATTDVQCSPSTDGWTCQVVVAEDGSESRHAVSLGRGHFERLAAPGESAEGLVRRSVAFLLEREPKESILRSFDLTDIGRYFPEFEGVVGQGGTDAAGST